VQVGDRVVVPSHPCGNCFSVTETYGRYAITPTPTLDGRKAMGHSSRGYSATPSLFNRGQAEYARVPFADVGLFKIPDGLTTNRYCFSPISSPLATWLQKTARLSLALSAVWAVGPVGQFAIEVLTCLVPKRVIALEPVRPCAKEYGKRKSSTMRRWMSVRRSKK